MSSNKLIALLVVLILIFGSILSYFLFIYEDDESNDNSNDENSEVEDNVASDDDVIDVGDGDGSEPTQEESDKDFTALTTYTGENQWEYVITGSLPNPCYSFEDEVFVAESFPEQVSITLKVTPPASEQVCTEVIQEVNVNGEYSASEGATMSFKVEGI